MGTLVALFLEAPPFLSFPFQRTAFEKGSKVLERPSVEPLRSAQKRTTDGGQKMLTRQQRHKFPKRIIYPFC